MDVCLEKFKQKHRKDAIVHISKAVESSGVLGEPTSIGYRVFDSAMLGGVREGDLIVSTGISGNGKTAWLINITSNLSGLGHNCLWFSYEVIPNNLFFKFKQMGPENNDVKVFMPKNIESGNVAWLEDRISNSLEEYGTKFVFIDHLDFLSPKDKSKSSDQYRLMIKEICAQLKSLAIKLKVIIFLVAHTKKVFGRHIEMQDIGESGGTYQLSDFVFSVSRKTIEVETENGKKMEIFDGNNGFVRLLKNRLTGEDAIMNYQMVNNKIINIDTEPSPDIVVEPIKEEGDVVERTLNLFGTNNN